MRVEFHGSPAKIRRQMLEWLDSHEKTHDIKYREIVRRSSSVASVTHPPEKPAQEQEEPPPPVPERVPASRDPGADPEALGKLGPQSFAEPVCQFCGKYSNDSEKRLARHGMHCKSNPNRIPHAKEGKPMNPALKAWQEKKRREKDLMGSSLLNANGGSEQSEPLSSESDEDQSILTASDLPTEMPAEDWI